MVGVFCLSFVLVVFCFSDVVLELVVVAVGWEELSLALFLEGEEFGFCWVVNWFVWVLPLVWVFCFFGVLFDFLFCVGVGVLVGESDSFSFPLSFSLVPLSFSCDKASTSSSSSSMTMGEEEEEEGEKEGEGELSLLPFFRALLIASAFASPIAS